MQLLTLDKYESLGHDGLPALQELVLTVGGPHSRTAAACQHVSLSGAACGTCVHVAWSLLAGKACMKKLIRATSNIGKARQAQDNSP
jgi:hypothetical protein